MDEDKLKKIFKHLEFIEVSIMLWWVIGAGIVLVKIVDFLLALIPPLK